MSMAEQRATILVVEDQADTRRFVSALLASEDVRVVEAASGQRGAIDAAMHKPDVVIVDLALPDMDGLEVIRTIRQWSSMPIVVLSARTQERTKVQALDAGADDYVTKPFGSEELLARVRVALRHRARMPEHRMSLRLGSVSVDLRARTATRDGQPVRLTSIEFRLLAALARHEGLVVAHRELLAEVWGASHRDDTHYLRVYMRNLREKLEADPVRPRHLLTESGVGYRLVADEPVE